ncbi:helix-turn-helix domain-containing protein [Paenibacillus segetis]|uniref:AraC family transcriptional regulator n=1 Tax=Paenibacillus segetis TaxID=1325360 RepID=A0ABQ1YXI7_9BACL|nr:helix-turn-helix domain-containing protein [Paenibacillus segetis]GGH40520.1 AraC family transcriptional regulator [Paenibacillus segetis]
MAKLTFKSPFMSKVRMFGNHFKSKLLLKYTFSYILMFLIPLTIVTMFIYENAVTSLRSEIEQSNVNQLNQVKMTIDDRMNELQEIASKIAYDQHLTPYMVRHPYYGLEAISTLASYKANSGILEELFLYFHNDNIIYSYRGLSDLDVVFGKMYHYENWSKEDVLRDLNESKQPIIRPAENVTVNSRKEPLLTLLVPIKPNDPFPNGTVVYLMSESKLMGVMDTILNDFSGSSYIFSQDGEVLTSNNRGRSLPSEVLGTLSSLQPGIHSMELDGEKHSVVAVKSTYNNWTYVTTMPSYQFFSRVAHIQTLIFMVFCIVVLTGIIAAMVLAKRQYHPIRDLIEFAKLKSKDVDTSKTRNEWDWIKQTIHNYSTTIDTQEPFVRNQCLLLLFKHGKPDDPEIEHMIAGAGLEFPHGPGQYFSVILAWDDTQEGEDSRQVRHHMQEMLGEFELSDLNTYVYGVEFSPADQFALMVSMPAVDEANIQAEIEQIIEAIQVTVIDNFQIIPYIGVGTVYSDLAGINQSFIEAATAMENRMMGSSSHVTYFEHLSEITSSTAETFWIPKKSMLKLEQSLKQGNESVADQMIASIIDSIKDESLPNSLLRCICFDLLNSLLRTAAELGVNEVFTNISKYSTFETLGELENKLTSMTAHICQQVQHNTETEQPSLIDNIVTYVDLKFADYTLSLEHVALKYSVSISYLSRSFKEKMGCNFSQYIWHRRMDEVIRLLINTNAPLKEIIESVGYLDAPNFIRKFKKETGYTPGQYRKMYASDSDIPAEQDKE